MTHKPAATVPDDWVLCSEQHDHTEVAAAANSALQDLLSDTIQFALSSPIERFDLAVPVLIFAADDVRFHDFAVLQHFGKSQPWYRGKYTWIDVNVVSQAESFLRSVLEKIYQFNLQHWPHYILLLDTLKFRKPELLAYVKWRFVHCGINELVRIRIRRRLWLRNEFDRVMLISGGSRYSVFGDTSTVYPPSGPSGIRFRAKSARFNLMLVTKQHSFGVPNGSLLLVSKGHLSCAGQSVG